MEPRFRRLPVIEHEYEHSIGGGGLGGKLGGSGGAVGGSGGGDDGEGGCIGAPAVQQPPQSHESRDCDCCMMPRSEASKLQERMPQKSWHVVPVP